MRGNRTNIWVPMSILVVLVFIAVNCRRSNNQPSPAQTITIGSILPLTGDASKYGQSAQQAIDLASQEINAKGGIKGTHVTIVYEDSQGNPKGTVSALQKLITTNKVPAIIGDLLSSDTLAMSPVAERDKVVLLSPTSSAPEITKAGDYIFRNCASDTFEGSIMAGYAYDKLHTKRVAIIYINNAYGVGIRDVFKSVFRG